LVIYKEAERGTMFSIEVNANLIANALCSGLEGGSGYWARVRIKQEGSVAVAKMTLLDQMWHNEPFVLAALGGGQLVVTDFEENQEYVLDGEALSNALGVMAKDYPQHLGDLLADNADAITGDVLIQCAVFGEVIYG
jgi:hypothetical protein